MVGTPVSVQCEDKFVSLGPLVDEMSKKQSESVQVAVRELGKRFRFEIRRFLEDRAEYIHKCASEHLYLMDDEQSEAVPVRIATRRLLPEFECDEDDDVSQRIPSGT